MSGGRPRTIHSRPTSGVGGREFTKREMCLLKAWCSKHGLDDEDEDAVARILEPLWRAFGSYQAIADATSRQVGVSEERRDLDTLLQRAKAVLPLVQLEEELTRDMHCLSVAGDLVNSLHAFPNLMQAQILYLPTWERFYRARRELRLKLAHVRDWKTDRAELVTNLGVLIDVCEQVESPQVFTKRVLTARNLLQVALVRLYEEQLYPVKLAEWRLGQTLHHDRNSPPPQHGEVVFARGVMRILRVPFEKKGVSG